MPRLAKLGFFIQISITWTLVISIIVVIVSARKFQVIKRILIIFKYEN